MAHIVIKWRSGNIHNKTKKELSLFSEIVNLNVTRKCYQHHFYYNKISNIILLKEMTFTRPFIVSVCYESLTYLLYWVSTPTTKEKYIISEPRQYDQYHDCFKWLIGIFHGFRVINSSYFHQYSLFLNLIVNIIILFINEFYKWTS